MIPVGFVRRKAPGCAEAVVFEKRAHRPVQRPVVLHHENFEHDLMASGLSQEEAHLKATEKYNYAKEALEYHGKIAKHNQDKG